MIFSEKKVQITRPEQVVTFLVDIMYYESKHDQDKEHFWAIGINTKNVIQYIDLVALGTLSTCLVHPRETFRLAVIKGVSRLILAHNHPSGSVEPSPDDIALTARMKIAGLILGIEVLDHIVFNLAGEFSRAE